MRTLLLSFAIVGLLCGCSSKSDYGEARVIVCDATMNTVTIVTDDNDTLSFSTVDTDRSGVDGLLLGDTAEITYRGRYEKGMGALKMVSYPQRALLGGDRDEHGCIGSAGDMCGVRCRRIVYGCSRRVSARSRFEGITVRSISSFLPIRPKWNCFSPTGNRMRFWSGGRCLRAVLLGMWRTTIRRMCVS